VCVITTLLNSSLRTRRGDLGFPSAYFQGDDTLGDILGRYKGVKHKYKYPKRFSDPYYTERFSLEELELFSKLRNLCTKARLRKQEYDPTVDWEYLFDIWTDQNGRCALSGLPLSIEVNHPHGVSLDRIDSNKGYERGNLQLLSFTVNRMKMDLNEEDFLEICSHVAKHQDK